jgi:hypothetical protein
MDGDRDQGAEGRQGGRSVLRAAAIAQAASEPKHARSGCYRQERRAHDADGYQHLEVVVVSVPVGEPREFFWRNQREGVAEGGETRAGPGEAVPELPGTGVDP